MAKKRKARQEKIIADLRRRVAMQETSGSPTTVTSSFYSLPTVKPVQAAATKQLSTGSYVYVLSDLKKTLILTAIAIATQLALYFLLAGR